jgi:sarcosine oxidase
MPSSRKIVQTGLLESRVCQYENCSDHNFILDRYPEAENVWIIGGGLGTRFLKHGPVIGEMAVDAVLGSKAPPAEMSVACLLRNRPEAK